MHRDLTPDNFILGQGNQIILIDFGAANEYIGTAIGTVIGKQNYIAPEQLQGKTTVHSDIYALGCTMHYLLTGVDPEPLTQSNPKSLDESISCKFDAIVSAATDYDSSNRPQSVSAFAAMINQPDHSLQRQKSATDRPQNIYASKTK